MKWYRTKIEKELEQRCLEVISLLDLIDPDKRAETETDILLIKMRADYFRYLCEFTTDEKYSS